MISVPAAPSSLQAIRGSRGPRPSSAPRTLGEAMQESPFQAVERYRAAIRSLAEDAPK